MGGFEAVGLNHDVALVLLLYHIGRSVVMSRCSLHPSSSGSSGAAEGERAGEAPVMAGLLASSAVDTDGVPSAPAAGGDVAHCCNDMLTGSLEGVESLIAAAQAVRACADGGVGRNLGVTLTLGPVGLPVLNVVGPGDGKS